ncbi:MAG: ABC transporter ATP-binding protein [Opitutales bacterium]|nr:ABC transporter ATP-binding protein [Opitutales bacterium]
MSKADNKPREEVRQDLSLARPSDTTDDRFSHERGLRKFDVKVFVRLFSWTRPYRLKRNLLILAVILRSIQIPALAWAIGAVINGAIAAGNMAGVLWGAAGFGLLALITQVTMHFRQRYALELGEWVAYDLRNAIFEHLMKMPLSWYQRTRLGSIISRITSDLEALRMGAQNVIFVSLVQFGQMIGSGILMAYYNFVLFLIIAGMAPIIFLINRYFSRRIGESSRLLQASFSRVTATVAESVKGIQVTQGFAREERNADLFRELIKDHSGYNMGLARNVALYLPILELNSQFFIAMIVIVGGYGVLNPEWNMAVGDLVTFFFLSNLFFSPIPSLGRQFTTALSAVAGAERIFRLLDTKPEFSDPEDAIELPPIKGRVSFQNLGFSYDGKTPVLDNIDFEVEPGQTMALVGHTGSGKSTLINLISKFYPAGSGKIEIDGYDISRIRSDSLRSQIGLVAQHNFLFSGTIIDNIRLGKPDASVEEVHQAVRALDFEDLIDSLPKGYQTIVGERGTGISLGQRQLICFARAMLADPRILILDEATASVDTVTEARLQKALAALTQNRTSFIVAHRLSTIRNADKVIVLDQGKIIESGSHNELLKANGQYASLYRQLVEEA